MYGELPKVMSSSGVEVEGFPIPILASPIGPKTALLRLPTSDELLTYLSSKRSLYRDLGRGKGRTEEVPTAKADQRLFLALRLDKGEGSVEFDDAEALYAIDLITRHRVQSCIRSGDTYVVTLATLFGDCTHTVRMPYQSERDEYQRTCFRAMDLPDNLEERRFPPEVPVKLYDKIVQSATGYVLVPHPDGLYIKAEVNQAFGEDVSRQSVPPHHKRSVVIAVLSSLSLLDPQLGGDSDPNS